METKISLKLSVSEIKHWGSRRLEVRLDWRSTTPRHKNLLQQHSCGCFICFAVDARWCWSWWFCWKLCNTQDLPVVEYKSKATGYLPMSSSARNSSKLALSDQHCSAQRLHVHNWNDVDLLASSPSCFDLHSRYQQLFKGHKKATVLCSFCRQVPAVSVWSSGFFGVQFAYYSVPWAWHHDLTLTFGVYVDQLVDWPKLPKVGPRWPRFPICREIGAFSLHFRPGTSTFPHCHIKQERNLFLSCNIDHTAQSTTNT